MPLPTRDRLAQERVSKQIWHSEMRPYTLDFKGIWQLCLVSVFEHGVEIVYKTSVVTDLKQKTAQSNSSKLTPAQIGN